MESPNAQMPAIEIQDLWKAFRGGKESIFSGVNLSVPKGQITFLLGPSGTGKSVLLKHIVGLMKPDQGEIRIFGIALPYGRARQLDEIRKRFGVLFQGSALFDGLTVFQNVAFPLTARGRPPGRGELRELVHSTLKSVGLDPDETERKLPSQLSGGMQKRVGLARAIILKPEIVLYDEPTTGLDPVNRATVEDMIAEAGTTIGLTNFVISHDIEAALALADQIAFLHDGKIVFKGSPREFEAASHPVIRGFLEAEKRHRENHRRNR